MRDATQWWNYSVATARALVGGHPPPTLTVRGLVLEPNEDAFLMTRGQYARFYAAGDGSWSAAHPFVAGRPAVVASAFLGAAVANSRAKSTAMAAATPMWREGHTTDVLLTDRRVLTYSAARGHWLSFRFRGVTEFHPDLNSWSV
ncbi:hypothetical protein [Williamsia herbipolensis]|uniref:hypothetical protein n=1 Tax=Williamsia herbipolensis TaxID=1603258 RepID=UPI0012378989|nr:hypothetical protein [Williamsia herbipolensis]